MLNKNDPLIAAVQQVMQQSNAEREATRIVNERFGIESRKSLPHEYQAHWDSEYQQVLSEGTDPSNYSEKQRKFAATAGDKRVIDGPDLTYVRKHGGKHIGEEQIEEKKMSDAQMKKREEIVKSMKKGISGFKKRYGERAKDVMYATATKQAMSEELEAIQEEIAYNLAEQAEYVYENYGEEGLVEFFESLTEEQLDILSMMEENMAGTPIRTNIWNKIKDAFTGTPLGQVNSAWSKPDTTANRDLGIAGQKADKTSAAIQNMNATTGQQSGQSAAGPNRGLGTSPAAPGKSTPPVPKPKPTNTATAPSAPAAKSTNTATPPATKKVKKVRPADIGSGGKQERGSSLGVTTGTTTNTTATNRPLSKAMRDNPVASFRKAPKATAGAALRKPGAARNALKDKGVTRAGVNRGVQNARNGTGSFSGGRNRGGGMGGGMGGRGGRGGEGRGGRGSLKEQIQNLVAQKIMEAEGSAAGMSYDKNSPTINSLRNKMYGSNPTPRTVQTGTQKRDTSAISPVVGSTTVAPRGPDTQALSNTARRAASGDVAPGPQKGANRVGAVIRTNAERIASRTGQNKSFDASYNAAAGTNPRNTALDQPNSQSPMAKAIDNKDAPTNMSGGGGDYRRAQASTIKVSDTEIMNDPKFKKALSSVGGTQAAKKIQVGQRVAGLGRFNKGDTIRSRVGTDIAARKNVGRES